MEPMTLGSPGSPSPSNNFLPSFLMGESNIQTTPRSNTLSPTKGRTLAFGEQIYYFVFGFDKALNFLNRTASLKIITNLVSGQSPRVIPSNGSPGDFNRSSMSMLQQRSLFGHQTPTTPNHLNNQQQQLNASLSGPPTQGLFDSLQSEKNRFPLAPGRGNPGATSNQHASANASFSPFNDSIINDSYLDQTDFNVSRITSPIRHLNSEYRTPNAFVADHQSFQNPLSPRQPAPPAPFWVTVFGFPQSTTNTILAHFSQCGTIVDKVLSQQGGNWVHLKYSSRLECDKAINYNERIIGNSLMIGVMYCRDAAIVDKENMDRNNR